MSGTISPCLWFGGNAEAAVRHYVGIFADSRIDAISHYGDNMPMPAGTVLTVEFTLHGRPFMALNGTPEREFTEAISLSVDCESQVEIDHYWEALLAGGGLPVQCGWLKDRHGVSWQISPRRMSEMLTKGSRAAINRVMQAMMPMVKLDLAALEAAFAGD